MGRERDADGRYVEEVTTNDVLSVFDRVEIPVLTASEVAGELDCSRPAAYNKLETLVGNDKLYKKKVGARAVVYISVDVS